MRYNVDLDASPGLPTIISEYYGPFSFSDAKRTALARLSERLEESLAQLQEECPAERLAQRRRGLMAVYKADRRTVSGWWCRDVNRHEQDEIAGPLSAIVQVLPRHRRHVVFAEIMQAVCSLDTADLQRLCSLIAKMSAADVSRQSRADDKI